MSGFETFKFFLTSHTGLAKDALHIYVALALFLGACLIFGWRTGQWKPWLLVLIAAIAGEVWDVYDTRQGNAPVRLMANFHDLWNTMLAPTILLLLTRHSGIFGVKPAVIAQPEINSGDQP